MTDAPHVVHHASGGRRRAGLSVPVAAAATTRVGPPFNLPLIASPAQTTAAVAQLCEQLALEPHPEGGFYRETFRDTAQVQVRWFSLQGSDRGM